MKTSISFGMLLLLGTSLLAFPDDPPAKAAPTKNVLFVCEHGAARSVIAAAEFNRIAEERGLPYRASFRGTSPDPVIAPAVAQSLASDGMRVEGKPTAVTRSDVESASHVVTFSSRLPAAPASLREWNDVAPPSSDLKGVREDIRQRVAKLIDEISASKK